MGDNLICKFQYNGNYFYITKNEKGKVRCWIKENKILKSIKKETHKKIVKEAIKKLNHMRYKLINRVNFGGKSYIWYVNSYIPQSIFVNANTNEICEYDENKPLYEKYNLNPDVVYISEETKKYFNKNIKSKSKIIKISVLGIVVSIILTANGTEFLSKNKIDENINTSNQEEIKYEDIDDIKIGTTIEEIEDAILKNNNLTQEEKEFIMQNFNKFFDDSKQYMNEKEIINTLETLEMKYEYQEYLPEGTTAGEYDTMNNEITFYVGNDIKEVINHSKLVPMHEVFHSMQRFGFGRVMEGITEIYTEEYGEEKSTAYYPKEKIWAQLLVEVFGKELILKDSLNNGVPEYIPERIKELSEETTLNLAENEIINLVSDINDSITYLEQKKFSFGLKSFEENKESEEKLESVFSRLEEYDRLLNGRKKNKMIDIYKDAILSSNYSELLEEGEFISNINKNYFINTEDTIKIEISNGTGYIYEEKNEDGNIIKIPYRNVIINKEGSILYKEELNITMKNILEEYNKSKEDYER